MAPPSSRNRMCCPQGFSGQYKVLVRRIWGQVATGKVTVDVYTHDGTPEVVHVLQQIPVSDRDALVTFDLADGRRKEPLDQAQLANAAADQMAVSRSVLAQQIGALADASSGSSGSSSTGSLPPVPGTNRRQQSEWLAVFPRQCSGISACDYDPDAKEPRCRPRR